VNLFKLVAAALDATGRRVILTEAENFPTDQYIAQGIARLFDDVEFRRARREELQAALDGDTALLLLTHVDYRGGHRHDMAALSAAARAVGALSLWDLSHSAGVLDVQLRRDGADLAVGCGYKFLNGGPGAPAFLYVRRDLQGRLENPIQGWMGHSAPFAFEGDYAPAPGIARFLSGTPSILGFAALDAGLDTFEDVELAAAEAKAGGLGDLFIAEVERNCPSLTLASPRDGHRRGGHVCFAHGDGYAIMQALIERGVIGDFRAPDLIRFGFAPLTTRFEDVVAAGVILREIMRSEVYRQDRFKVRRSVT
jgi:kynureninase